MKTILGMIALSVALAAGARAEVPVTVRDALKEVQKYDMTQTRVPHIAVDDFAHKADAAQRKELAGMLVQALADTQTTDVAKTLICQLLALVGTEAEVQALAKMLDDVKHGQDARYALQGLALPAADEALRDAMSRLKGPLLVGVINSLGERGDVKAIQEFAKQLKDADVAVVDAAARALGNIGTENAAKVLLDTPGAGGADARLVCAGKLAAAGSAAIAADLCRKLVGADQKSTVRVAALFRLSAMGANDAVSMLIPAMDDKDSFVSASAMRFAGRIKGSAVTEALIGKLKSLEASRQVLMLDVLAARGDGVARKDVETLATATDPAVRAAALTALSSVGNVDSLKVLVAATETEGVVKAAAELALATLKGAGVDKAVREGISAGTVPSRVVMAGVAAARMLKEAIPELMAAARDQDSKVRVAAVQAISKVADADAYPKLVDLLVESDNPVVREALRVAAAVLSRRVAEPKDRLAPLSAALQKGGISPEAVAVVLKTMGAIGCSDAVVIVREKLAVKDLTIVDAAVRALADWQDESAVEDLIKVAETSANSLHKTLALRGVMRLAPEGGGQAMKWLAKVKPLVREKNQKQQLLAALGELKNVAAMDMAVEMLSDNDVSVEAGLATATIGKDLVKTQAERVDEAMTKVLAVIKEGAAAGKAREVQADAQKVLAEKTAASTAVSAAPVAVSSGPQLVQDKPAAPGQKKILLVTGCDIHKWKLIEPVLRDAVSKDPRLNVTITEDVKFLALPDLKNYDVILLNYMNWNNPEPGAEVQEGLRKAVEGGTGLVMVHFTCGAFQRWPEFVKVAGRVWNPKFRGHDPWGEFKVEITDKAHPIMTGMEDFQTLDELYTCLDGNEPIHVIAKAVSKVDKKDYPMAFTHEYGKGRVFQSVLGHDVKAFESEFVRKLYRNACAWAAGLEPKE